jgi:hypothetical protein
VKIFFHPGVNIAIANAQVTAISQVLIRQMPPGTLPPLIVNYNASTVPILQLALAGQGLSEQNLADIGLTQVRTPLVTVPGAAIPFPYGGKSRQVQIDLNLPELQARGLGAQDVAAALASQNAAVAAEAQGLGVVYIGGMRDRPEEVAAELGLPPRTVAVFGMCVGYPDPARPTSIKPRLPIDAVLHRERYDTAAQGEPVDRYVATMVDFYKSQQMKTNGDWAEHSLHRVRGPEAMRGRDRLAEALKARGFLAR